MNNFQNDRTLSNNDHKLAEALEKSTIQITLQTSI